MRTTTYRSIRNGVLRRMGLDAAQPILGSQAAAIADYLGTAIEEAWGHYDWPDTTPSATFTPAGSTISYGTTIGQILRITDLEPTSTRLVQTFTFAENSDSTAATITDTRYTAGDDVFVKYRTPIPRFTSSDYAAATTYAPGDVVYYDQVGDCYLCILATTGNAPTDTTYWVRQRIPALFADYLKIMGHASTLEEDGQYDKATMQLAKAANQLVKMHDDAFFRENHTPQTWSIQRDPVTPY